MEIRKDGWFKSDGEPPPSRVIPTPGGSIRVTKRSKSSVLIPGFFAKSLSRMQGCPSSTLPQFVGILRRKFGICWACSDA